MSLDLGGEAPCYAHLFPPPSLAEGTATALLYDLADAVVICDLDGRIVFWNDASERVFGWPADDVLDRTFDVLIPKQHRVRQWEAYRRVLASVSAGCSTELVDAPAVDRDGRPLRITFTITLVRHEGLVSGVAAVIRDQTERSHGHRRLNTRVPILDRQPSVLPL